MYAVYEYLCSSCGHPFDKDGTFQTQIPTTANARARYCKSSPRLPKRYTSANLSSGSCGSSAAVSEGAKSGCASATGRLAEITKPRSQEEPVHVAPDQGQLRGVQAMVENERDCKEICSAFLHRSAIQGASMDSCKNMPLNCLLGIGPKRHVQRETWSKTSSTLDR